MKKRSCSLVLLYVLVLFSFVPQQVRAFDVYDSYIEAKDSLIAGIDTLKRGYLSVGEHVLTGTHSFVSMNAAVGETVFGGIGRAIDSFLCNVFGTSCPEEVLVVDSVTHEQVIVPQEIAPELPVTSSDPVYVYNSTTIKEKPVYYYLPSTGVSDEIREYVRSQSESVLRANGGSRSGGGSNSSDTGSFTELTVTGSATSTFAQGINITDGCFAIDGVCLTAGGGGGSGTVNSGTQGQLAYFASNGTVISGTSTIFLTTDGNVGIGTTSPVEKFTVQGSSQFTIPGAANIVFGSGTIGEFTDLSASNVALSARSGSRIVSLGNSDSSNIAVFSDSNYGQDIAFGSASDVAAYFNGGNVGIGTTSPYAKLTIQQTVGGSAPLFTVASSTSGAATSTAFHIDANGRIGIGTSFPDNFVTIGTSVNSTGNLPGVGLGASANRYFTVGQSGFNNVYMGWVYNATALSGYATIGTYSYTNPLRIDASSVVLQSQSSGNVGIGTTSPYAKLSVNGLIVGSHFIATTTATSTFAGGIQTAALNITGSATSTFAQGINLASGCFAVNGTCIGGAGGSSQWTTSGSDIYYTTGSVGVGTTSPFAKLSVQQTAGGSAPLFTVASSTSGAATSTAFHIDAFGRIGLGTTTQTTARLAVQLSSGNAFQAYNAAGTSIFSVDSFGNVSATAGIATANNTVTGSSVIGTNAVRGGNLVETGAGTALAPSYRFTSDTDTGIYSPTANNLGFVTGGAEAMRIIASTSGSNVGIGTTTPWRTLSASGTVAFNGLTALSGSNGDALCLNPVNKEVTVNTGAQTCTVSSARFKHDIENLDIGGLDTIEALRSVSFAYNGNDEERIGFIAEEVLQVDSRLVFTEADGTPRGVRYEDMTSVLTKAVQELWGKVKVIIAWFSSDGSRFNVQGEVCVDDVCVTKEEFKSLLINAASPATPEDNGDDTNNDSSEEESVEEVEEESNEPEAVVEDNNEEVPEVEEVVEEIEEEEVAQPEEEEVVEDASEPEAESKPEESAPTPEE